MFSPVILTKEELASPPSCIHGMLMEEEVDLRRRYELFLRTAGLYLRLYPLSIFDVCIPSFINIHSHKLCIFLNLFLLRVRLGQ